MTQINWNDKFLLADMKTKNKKLLRCICVQVERDAKKNLYPGHGLLTGTLRRSITHEVVGDVGRVGTNVEYGIFIELGTSKMSASPYLRPALESFNQAKLNKCINFAKK